MTDGDWVNTNEQGRLEPISVTLPNRKPGGEEHERQCGSSQQLLHEAGPGLHWEDLFSPTDEDASSGDSTRCRREPCREQLYDRRCRRDPLNKPAPISFAQRVLAYSRWIRTWMHPRQPDDDEIYPEPNLYPNFYYAGTLQDTLEKPEPLRRLDELAVALQRKCQVHK